MQQLDEDDEIEVSLEDPVQSLTQSEKSRLQQACDLQQEGPVPQSQAPSQLWAVKNSSSGDAPGTAALL